MRISEYMENLRVVFSVNQSVNEVLSEVFKYREDNYPVIDEDGRLLGTVSPTDILEVIAQNKQPPTSIGSLINSNVQTMSEDIMLDEIPSWEIGEIFVVNGQGKLMGRLSPQGVGQILEKNLQLYKVQLKILIQSVHNGILAVNRRGKITVVNTAAERLLGISANDVIGSHLLDILPDSEALLKVMETKKKELSSIHHLGDMVYLVNRTPVIENNKVIGAVSVFQDLTELESIHAQLQSAKELNKELDGIIDSSYDAIVVTDGEGKLLKVSSSYSRITGAPQEQIDQSIGKNMAEIEKEGLISKSVSLMVLEQRKTVTFKQKIFGQETIITGNPIFDDTGKIVRVVTNIRDMSKINALKEEVNFNRKLNAIYSTELANLRAKHMKLPEAEVHSPKMKRVMEVAYRVAQVDSTVLITGETGVGKEMIAKYIHQSSSRKDQPFVPINCGAIPENLLESELFGYEKGAFTGAERSGKVGIFEVANKGTLFLDEIGEMPKTLQVKLLRVLQEQKIQRIGGIRPIELDLRIITATNRNLAEMVQQGTFREDLFYRLNVLPIHIPSLRERPEDILPLANYLLNKFNGRFGLNKKLSTEVSRYLERCYWAGNVRELENILEQMTVMSSADDLTISDIPVYLDRQVKPEVNSKVKVYFNEIISFKEAEEIVERELLTMTLRHYNSIRQAAKVLGVNHSTVIRKLNKYNMKI